MSFAYIAAGRCDVYLGRYLKPWDMAAGMLLVSEAGGKVDGLVDGIDLCKPKQHVVAANSIVFGNFKHLIEN